MEVVGRALECDCLWRTERLVVELDGHAFHAPRSAFEVDRARDRALQVAGWRVVRFTWRQLEKEAGKVVEDLRALLAPRANLDRRMISTNQFKNGTHVDIEGTVFKIVEFQHVKPGKGPAFVRTKLKRLSDGASLDRTFRAGEKFRPVRTEARKMQFLYSDGSDAHFMDLETYEQTAMPEAEAASALRWLLPSEEVDVLYVDGSPADLQVPSAVELAVADTEPGVRGDTASGGGDKPATLESGVVVRVPLFVNAGDRVRVDTRSGEYVARA
ncbi:MAG: elongation factor P [Thermoleophilaceae bacterium]